MIYGIYTCVSSHHAELIDVPVLVVGLVQDSHLHQSGKNKVYIQYKWSAYVNVLCLRIFS